MKQATLDELVEQTIFEAKEVRQKEINDITFFKHGNNPFSNEANKSIKQNKAQLRQRVFSFIKECGVYGATAEECERELKLGRSTVSARYTELKALNKIHLTGRRKTSSGRSAGVYRVI